MAAMASVKSCMKKKHFFHGVVMCCLLITSILLFLFSFWFPSMEGNLLLTTLLPDMKNSIANANCLFIVVNLIIVILVGESRLGGGSSSRSEINPSADNNGVYNEYVEKKRRSITRRGRGDQKKKNDDVEVRERKREEREDINGNQEEEEFDGLEKEELNRRVEEFIARVNEQRWVEARAF